MTNLEKANLEKANLEKAKEIFKENRDACIRHGFEQDEEEIIFMLEKMAEWKDEQFKAEKQVDSPIKWNKNTKDCKPKVNHSILMKTTHGIVEGEWQGEQWYQYRWAGIVRDSDVLSWIELFNLEMKGK